jgi:hypothetical protein
MKSSRNWIGGFMMAAIMIAAQPAYAQRSLFGRSQSSLVSLAANEAVQKDLGCSQFEMNKLRDLQDRYRSESQKALTEMGISFQNFRSLTDEQRNAASAKMAEVNTRLVARFTPRLAEILVPDQLKRLRQIQIQAGGIDVLLEAETATDLGLTDEQKKSLTEIRDEYSRRQQGLFRGDGDQGDRSARSREMEEERDRKTSEVLTSLQRERLIALQGEPFDVSLIRSRRGN